MFSFQKVATLAQYLFTDIEKIIFDSQKLRIKLEKLNQNDSKNALIAKNLKTSKSTPNLDASLELDINFTSQLNIADVNMVQLITNTREKYVNEMIKIYEEAFKTIRDTKVSSLEPVI